MPQRRLDLRLPPPVADPVEDLAQLVLSMPPETLRIWSQHLDPGDLALVEQILAEKAATGWRVDPATMAAFLDPTNFQAWPYMRLLASKFVDGIEGRSPRQIWSLPSRMGKTTLVRWCIAFGLDREPRSRWIYTTYGDGLASETGDAVRQILRIHADALRAQLRQDMARRDRFMTPEGGGLLCRGFGSGIIGFGAGVPGLGAAGGGLFVDDPMKNWQEAHSPSRREKVANHYFGVLRHRIDEESIPIIVVHARWHAEDLSGELQTRMENETGEAWETIKIPALAVEEDPANDPLGRAKGEPIEPERFTREQVLARHLGMADTYIVQAIEQQQPLPDQGIELLREWFILAESAELPRRAEEALTSWDLKLKNREAGDYVVGQVWWRVGSVFWLMDTIRGKYDHATTENAIALLAVRHPEATRHIIEAAGSADEVVPELRKPIDGYTISPEMQARLGMSDAEVGMVEKARREGLAHLTPNAPTMSKEIRARTYIAPAAEAGQVRMPADAPWIPALLSELAAFGAPGDHHDDQVDAMSQAIQKLRRGGVMVKHPAASARRPTPRPGIQRSVGPRPRGGSY